MEKQQGVSALALSMMVAAFIAGVYDLVLPDMRADLVFVLSWLGCFLLFAGLLIREAVRSDKPE